MRIKTYLIWDYTNKKVTWQDDLPVTRNGIEIGKIINVNFSKLTGIAEVTMNIHEDNVKEVKKLLRI